MLIGGKFVMSGTTPDDREPIRAIPGSDWSKRYKAWVWKPDHKTYKQILISFPGIHISDEVKVWVEKHLRGVQKLKYLKNLPPEELTFTNAIMDRLYPYQKVGVNFMKKSVRTIVGDDMGLGKTLESIAAAEETGCKRVLVITLNSIKFNWESEIIKWGTGYVTVVNGDKKQRDKQLSLYKQYGKYLIINYEGVRIHQEELTAIEWDAIIVDEAHRLKNRDTLHTIACKRLRSKYCWLLTGTPMENAPHELWSLLNMLFPDYFSSFWKFVEQYCVMNEFDVEDKTVRVPTCAISSKEIHELLQPIMIRRLKEEVLPDLPDKQYVTIPVEMSKDDRRVYKELLKEMISITNKGDIIATPTVLTQYTRLKQVCITQHLLDSTKTSARSAKLDALEDLVESCIADHKIVVYTCFSEALKIVRTNLQARGWKTVEIFGEITPEGRQMAINLFQNDPTVRICLCTIQAGGTGLDGLQYASDIEIFLDKHPNPMKNLQAEDRLMRIGQKNALTVYSIINKDSIEEYVEYKLMQKEMSFNKIIDGQYTFLEKYMEHFSKSWK